MAIFHSYVKLPEGKLHCRHLSLGFSNEGLQQSNHWIVFATSVTVTPGIECPTLTKPFHCFSQSQTREGSKFVWWDSQEAPTFCCLLSMSNCFGKILTHHQIHRHSTAFSSPQRERRPTCHLRKLTRSCNVLGMHLSVRNVWIICGSKAFHVSLQNLERCTYEDELVTAHERNVWRIHDVPRSKSAVLCTWKSSH